MEEWVTHFRNTAAAVFLVVSVAFPGIAMEAVHAEPAVTGYRDISARDAFELIRKNDGSTDFVILDVRTPAEYEEDHIRNAVLVDILAGSFPSEMERLDREKTYVVYCRSGNRSRSALDIMRRMDFRNVYHIDGGITRWRSEKLPTVR